MYHNPLIYCTCWDPWNLEPRKLIKTLSHQKNLYREAQANSSSSSFKKNKIMSNHQQNLLSPPKEQISVTLGDEMFDRKKRLKSEIMDKIRIAGTDIITDLEEQISELTMIIEQMNRDHQSANTTLSNEMEIRCAEMKQDFENKSRELKEAHAAELSELENNYKAALKEEKLASQEKLEEMGKEYKYLKNMFFMYQDSLYDEMEDKLSKKKAEWEKDEKSEREKILLQQKNTMTKKFELESEEEKRKLSESYSALFENFTQEKEELLKQHEKDTLQLKELKKTNEIIEEELHAQAVILESLNTTLYQTQMELQKEKATVTNLEKTLQTKLAETEEKFKFTIQLLREENIHLRQKINTKNGGIYEERSGRSTCLTIYEDDTETLEEGSNKRQEL